MSNPTFDFVHKMFLEYYKECFNRICMPRLFEKREFGTLLLNERIMVRHKKFETATELQSFLCTVIPSDVYCSSAYYEQPDALEMGAKGWSGADLIFDIDADHLSTPCDKVHDNWVCGKCGFSGKGVAPEKCPICNGEKFDVNTWPCEQCIDSAKEEIIKLLEMLTNDFGFSEKEIHVFFSGHRGYHVHVENEAIKTLDSMARKEIVDYTCSVGLDVVFQGLRENKSSALNILKALRLDDSGWRGRIAKGLYIFLSSAKQEDYRNIGLKKNVIEAIMANKDTILRDWREKGAIPVVKGVGFKNWKKLAECCARSQSANIDTVVTTDVHRLIRLVGTLHGKTGLKKVEFPISKIEDFDPFRSAVAFKSGSANVFVRSAPKFRLGEEIFGPYKNQKAELPTAAAMLLIRKNRAEVIDYNV